MEIKSAFANADSARDFAAASTPNSFTLIGATMIVFVFIAIANAQIASPTANALPGNRAAFSNQSSGACDS